VFSRSSSPRSGRSGIRARMDHFHADSLRVYDSNIRSALRLSQRCETLKLIDVVNVGEVPKRINT